MQQLISECGRFRRRPVAATWRRPRASSSDESSRPMNRRCVHRPLTGLIDNNRLARALDGAPADPTPVRPRGHLAASAHRSAALRRPESFNSAVPQLTERQVAPKQRTALCTRNCQTPCGCLKTLLSAPRSKFNFSSGCGVWPSLAATSNKDDKPFSRWLNLKAESIPPEEATGTDR